MSTFPIAESADIKILIADESPLVREALTRIVRELGCSPAVLEADGIEAAEQVVSDQPGVTLAIVDVLLPGTTGVEAVARMLQAAPNVPILVLSAKDDPATVRAALDAGARGFMSKRSPTGVMVEAMRLVMVGGMYLPPQVLRPVAADSGTLDEDPVGAARSLGSLSLTPRQRDVLALLMQGMPNKTICRELALAEGTVKTHTAAIYRALGVTNRTQAVYAMSRLGADLPPVSRPVGGAATVAPRDPRPIVRATTRARAAAESLRTVTSRLQAAAEGGGRWAAMLGFQPT